MKKIKGFVDGAILGIAGAMGAILLQKTVPEVWNTNHFNIMYCILIALIALNYILKLKEDA